MASAIDNAKVKEGGGRNIIRIGATGKVSALMMQELDTHMIVTSSSKKPAQRLIQTAPVSTDCRGSTKRLQRMMSSNGGSSSSSNVRDQVIPKNMKQTSQKIPMLDSEDLWIDKTPIRGKEQRKKVKQRIVETVDLKCGKHEGTWSVTPIGNQLRRLSFSKISD